MKDLNTYLTQGERLEFAPIAPHILDASTLGEAPEVTTLSTPSGGFRMPSREAIRMNDARLSAFGGLSTHESEECDDETGDDSDDAVFIADNVRTYLPTYEERESLALPSRQSFGRAIQEAFHYGYSCESQP